MSALAKLFVIVLLAIIVYLGLQWLFLVTEWRPVPICEEDTVLVGTGSFSYGRWEFYTCGAAFDDFILIPAPNLPTPEPEPAEFGGFNA